MSDSELSISSESDSSSTLELEELPTNIRNFRNTTGSCYCAHCDCYFPDYKTLSAHQENIVNSLFSNQRKRKSNVRSDSSENKFKKVDNTAERGKNQVENKVEKNLTRNSEDNSLNAPSRPSAMQKPPNLSTRDPKAPVEKHLVKIVIPCQYCKKVFDNHDAYNLHFAEKHSKMHNELREKLESEQSKRECNSNTNCNIVNEVPKKNIEMDRKNANVKNSVTPESNPAEMAMLMDYLKKHPVKIKLLLQLLNLMPSQPRMKLYSCVQCCIHMIKKREFQKHLQTHNDKKFKCDHCKLNFTLKSLRRHLSVHEKDGVTAKDFDFIEHLELSGSESANDERTSRLPSIDHDNQNIPVTESDKRNSIDGTRENQSEVVTPSVIKKKKKIFLYTCDDCDEVFLEYAKMVSHKRENTLTHFDIKSLIKCRYCGLKFGRSRTLNFHIRRHHRELKLSLNDFVLMPISEFQPVSAPVDQNRAQSTAEKILNPDVNPVQTNQAGTSRKPPINLYLCTSCGLHYIERRNVLLHIHRERNNLQDHIQRGNNGLACEICKLKFSSYTLATHVKRHHRVMKANKIEDYLITPITPTGNAKFASSYEGRVEKTKTVNKGKDIAQKSSPRAKLVIKQKKPLNAPKKPLINLYRCRDCGLNYLKKCNVICHQYRERENLQKHIERSNMNGKYCKICKLKFSGTSLQMHEILHHRKMKANRIGDYHIIPYHPRIPKTTVLETGKNKDNLNTNTSLLTNTVRLHKSNENNWKVMQGTAEKQTANKKNIVDVENKEKPKDSAVATGNGTKSNQRVEKNIESNESRKNLEDSKDLNVKTPTDGPVNKNLATSKELANLENYRGYLFDLLKTPPESLSKNTENTASSSQNITKTNDNCVSYPKSIENPIDKCAVPSSPKPFSFTEKLLGKIKSICSEDPDPYWRGPYGTLDGKYVKTSKNDNQFDKTRDNANTTEETLIKPTRDTLSSIAVLDSTIFISENKSKRVFIAKYINSNVNSKLQEDRVISESNYFKKDLKSGNKIFTPESQKVDTKKEFLIKNEHLHKYIKQENDETLPQIDLTINDSVKKSEAPNLDTCYLRDSLSGKVQKEVHSSTQNNKQTDQSKDDSVAPNKTVPQEDIDKPTPNDGYAKKDNVNASQKDISSNSKQQNIKQEKSIETAIYEMDPSNATVHSFVIVSDDEDDDEHPFQLLFEH